jgi:hypothetical protein
VLLLAQHIGFFGLHGLIGFLVGLIVFIIIGVILWRILVLLLSKVPIDGTWQTIILLILALIFVLIFLQTVGIWTWAS